jgi:hypothetical protein
MRELEGLGISRREAHKVMNACGPGQVSEVIKYTHSLNEINADFIFALFGGLQRPSSEDYSFGRERANGVIRASGVPTMGECAINWRNSRTFFRILKGTRILKMIMSKYDGDEAD